MNGENRLLEHRERLYMEMDILEKVNIEKRAYSRMRMKVQAKKLAGTRQKMSRYNDQKTCWYKV